MKETFSVEEQQNLVLIASGKVFEPFEDQPLKLKTTDELAEKLEKSKTLIGQQTKKWGGKAKHKISETELDKKFNNLLQNHKAKWQNLTKIWDTTEEAQTKTTSFLKTKFTQIKEGSEVLKNKVQQSPVSKKLNKTVKTNLQKSQKSWSKLQEISQQKQENLNQKTQQIAINHVLKGLEMVLEQDSEAWILQKAKTVLPEHSLEDFEAISGLNQVERQKLIVQLYPNGNQNFQSYARTFDYALATFWNSVKTVNLAVQGADGNSDAPSMDVAKALVKIANRLHILSITYGQKLENIESLFYVSAHIFEDLHSWSTKTKHTPLDSNIIADLYKKQAIGSLEELLKEAFEQANQLSIPMFGPIQIEGFVLDIQKIDLLVLSLVDNYFCQKHLEEEHGKKAVSAELKVMQQLLVEYKKQNALKKWSKKPEASWQPFIQTMKERLHKQHPSKLVSLQQSSLVTYQKIKAKEISLQEARAQIQKEFN